MKIAFLLGSPDISGGTNIIFEYATRLNDLGHSLTIVTEKTVEKRSYSWHSNANQLCWKVFHDLEGEEFDLDNRHLVAECFSAAQD